MLPGANSGMKRIKCGWTQPLFRKVRNIGYLAVETWRVKTELIIITILHIIIITTSILNLDFKTFAPKILAHRTCINRYWKYTQILAAKNQAKLTAKTELAELTAKIIKYRRPPTIIIYSQNICLHQNIRAHEIFAPMKYSRPWNICAHEISASMKYLRPHEISAPRQECSRLIIYDRNKATVEISAAYKRCWRPQM